MSFASDNIALVDNPHNKPMRIVRGLTSATANQLTAVRLEGEFRKVAIQFLTNAGRITDTADGESVVLSTTIGADNSDYWTLPGDTAMDLNLAFGRAVLKDGFTFYITSATAGTEYQIIAERAGS